MIRWSVRRINPDSIVSPAPPGLGEPVEFNIAYLIKCIPIVYAADETQYMGLGLSIDMTDD